MFGCGRKCAVAGCVAVVAATGCGETTSESGSAPSAGGGGGADAGPVLTGGAGGQSDGARWMEALLDACPEVEGFSEAGRLQSWEFESAGGAGGGGLAETLDCTFPLCAEHAEDGNPNWMNVALDCTAIPRVDIDDSSFSDVDFCWTLDDPEAPASIVLNDAACQAVQRGEIERMDAVWGYPVIASNFPETWWDGTCTLPE